MGLDEGKGAPAPAAAGQVLQFDKVELASADAGRACKSCQRRIADEYFEIAGNVVCPACAAVIRGGKGGRGAFLRASLLGGGAALLGTIVWYIIMKKLDAEYGLVAIGVGLFVGFAVRKGSGRRGGWKYQALAMLLTYFSVTASKVPFVVQGLVEKSSVGEKGGAAKAGGAETAAAKSAAGEAPAANQPAAPGARAEADARPGVGAFILAALVIFGIAFASPFLAGTSNIMGIIILSIALYEAWKINKRVPLTGPFRLAPAAAAPPAVTTP